MKTVTIPQKLSGTGTIHDVASQHFDREIHFPESSKYAVVLASYYGNGKLYTTHRTEIAAVKESNRQREYSHMIVDDDDNWYTCDGCNLIPV
jgi:hypothetical protein